jgi:hypothetical protein
MFLVLVLLTFSQRHLQNKFAKSIFKRRPWNGPILKTNVRGQPIKASSLTKPISKRRPWDGPLVKPASKEEPIPFNSLTKQISKKRLLDQQLIAPVEEIESISSLSAKSLSKRKRLNEKHVKPVVNVGLGSSPLVNPISKRGPVQIHHGDSLLKSPIRGSNSIPKNPLLENVPAGASSKLLLNQQRILKKQKLLNEKVVPPFRK